MILRRILCNLWLRLALCAVFAGAFVVQGYLNSRQVEVTHTSIAIQGLPAGLQGLKVVQISDLHSTLYGAGQEELLSLIRAEEPDIIALTGDFVDGYHPNEDNCVTLAKGLTDIAPVFRIRGNHEYYQSGIATQDFDRKMADAGVRLLENEALVLRRNGTPWLLAGLDDIMRLDGDMARDKLWFWQREAYDAQSEAHFARQLSQRMPEGEYGLRLMLSHRPYYWQIWADMGFDAALTGHLHGLQVRVPRVGGVALLGSSYFPQADCGLYSLAGIQVYISRGLARQSGLRGLRINNRPELAVLTFDSR